MSDTVLIAIITGSCTLLASFGSQVVVHILGRRERRIQRALDRATEEFKAQVSIAAATPGQVHIIKPLRFWILAHLSFDEVTCRGPKSWRNWRNRKREEHIIRLLREADRINASLLAWEMHKHSKQNED